MPVQRSIYDRLWSKVVKDKAPDGCWLFVGYQHPTRKYGMLGAGGRGAPMLYVHRVAYEQYVGPIPKGMYVLHRCDTPNCVRPSHLVLGTQLDNMRDMMTKGRRGHTGPMGRLTEAQLQQIEAARLSGKSIRSLAEAHGISQSTLSHHLRRRRS